MVKSGLNLFNVETAVNSNETHKLEVNDLGSNFMTLKMNSARVKNINLNIQNQIGVGGDFTLMKIQNFPVGPVNKLEVNIKQGNGGVEILNNGPQFNLNVTMSSKINKVSSQKTFTVPVEKGVRLMPASFLTEKELTVSSIDKIFGPGIKTIRIK
jgi:hypothetical protein